MLTHSLKQIKRIEPQRRKGHKVFLYFLCYPLCAADSGIAPLWFIKSHLFPPIESFLLNKKDTGTSF
jgi:hypothetical protein